MRCVFTLTATQTQAVIEERHGEWLQPLRGGLSADRWHARFAPRKFAAISRALAAAIADRGFRQSRRNYSRRSAQHVRGSSP